MSDTISDRMPSAPEPDTAKSQILREAKRTAIEMISPHLNPDQMISKLSSSKLSERSAAVSLMSADFAMTRGKEAFKAALTLNLPVVAVNAVGAAAGAVCAGISYGVSKIAEKREASH